MMIGAISLNGFGGYGFKGRGKLGIRHEREGHYSDAVQKTQNPSRTGRPLFRCRAENSESSTNGKATIQMPCKKLRVQHEREGHEFHSCHYATENELAL